MIAIENLEKIKSAVHRPLNWDDYSSTIVLQNTNGYSHAIGSTVISDSTAYMPGRISGKEDNDTLVSTEEIKYLFAEDMSMLELEIEEIEYTYKALFLESISKMQFASNEHIIVIFAKVRKDESVRTVNFLRYDPEKKLWSEKKALIPVRVIENIEESWPSLWNDRLIGIFKVRR